MKVLKFGGTSLGRPQGVSAAVEVVRAARQSQPVAVVVSALSGVTDALTEAARRSARGEGIYEEICAEIEDRHHRSLRELTPEDEQAELARRVSSELSELADLLHGVTLVRECSRRTLDLVLSYGERLSAPLVAGALRRIGVPAEDCDARRLITTDDAFGNAHVDEVTTYERIRRHFADHRDVQVVTGFIAATRHGETTTLGRGGSDLTASLLGAALGVDAIELWTDVDGVMSADPRLVPGAFSLACLSYDELMELSHFGAKVVYPPTVHPARGLAIPLVIKNTLNPAFSGTHVTSHAPTSDHPIRGICSIPRVALLRLEGDGMVGVPGTAHRLFQALAREGISVILISQASSEHSICFAVAPDVVAHARDQIDREFHLERQAGLIDDLVVEEDLAVVAAVGEGMRERPGIAGRLFSVLGQRGINVRAIAQGSSELNISLVLHREQEAQALQAIHDAFFASEESPLNRVFIAGTGRVGGALLEQLAAAGEDRGLCLCGVTNRRVSLVEPGGLDPRLWRDELEGRGNAADLDLFVRAVLATPGSRVLVDVTAGDEVPARYRCLLEAGVPVVTANKRLLAAPTALRKELLPSCAGYRGLYYETTVGAGLPVIGTLRRLVETGDRVRRIEGIFSGTLGYLCSQLRSGASFSQSVRRAYDQGYTEPDPREDLRGTDVARKLLILAREVGLEVEPEDVVVESLLTPTLEAGGVEDFWSSLADVDEAYAKRQARARGEGRVLTYLARLEEGRMEVGLEAVKPQHPCASATGPENLFAFYTERYSESPLVVRGPGAGPQVTAAGVFADVLQALAENGAQRSR